MSQSALSQTVRTLEARLGLRLLTRTTRSVAPTEVGERLLRSVGPRIDEIQAELAGLSDLRDRPAGTIRISADEHAASMVLWPALQRFLPNYPDIKAEIVVDNGLIDIVAERFDAGVRTGNIIAKDMIAVPIGPDIRMVVVGSPSYLTTTPAPKIPQDLTSHRCINLRLPTHGGIYAWEFEKGRRELRVRVDGQLVLNSIPLMLNAALAGFGLAYLAGDQVSLTCRAGVWCRCWAIGVRLTQAITSITRAVGSLRPRSRCSSRPFATGAQSERRRIQDFSRDLCAAARRE